MRGFTKIIGLPKGLLASLLLHLSVYGTAIGVIAWNEAHAEFRTNIDQSNAPLLTLETHPPPPPEPWILAQKVAHGPIPPVPPTPTPEESSATASRLPSWTEGFITEDDYPTEMRKEKKDGRVIAEVLIDVEGYVRSVSIVQGAGPAFNQVVLDKLKDARFRPALDQTGRPMNCRVRVPISFKLN